MFDPKSTEKIWGLDSGTGKDSIMFDPNILHQWVKHYLLPDDDLPGEKNKLKIICFISCIIEILFYLCPILITNTNQMDDIIKRLTMIKDLLDIEEEIKKGDLSKFNKATDTKIVFSKKQNMNLIRHYITYRRRKRINDKEIYNVTFLHRKNKYQYGSDEFNNFIADKWEKFKEKKKIDIDSLKKEQEKWSEFHTSISITN